MNHMRTKHQLEYFYLIPVDEIVSKIRSEISDPRTTDVKLLFDVIFKHVYTGAAYYYDFIEKENTHTFLGEEGTAKLRSGLCQLLYFTLENNCILNDCFNKLALSSAPIEFSAKNLPIYEKSITALFSKPTNSEKLKGDVDSQFFNNRKNVYKRNLQDDNYISAVIDALNISENRDNLFPINTLQYIMPAMSFLFMEDISSKFGRSLNKKNQMLDKYKDLWKKYIEKKDRYSSTIDQLIFQSEMENIFGFSFWRTIYPWLKTIHEMESSESKSLKDLEGQPFLRIILQISNLPLFYGKPLFFRYICYAFTSSKSIDSSYFNESPKEVMSIIPPAPPKAVQIVNGLDLMNKFCQILSSVSLPVLFSLWNVVLSELEQQNFFDKKLIDIYFEYLESNNKIPAFDNISDEQLLAYFNECMKKDIPFDNSFLRTHLPTAEIGNIDPQDIFPYDMPVSLRESMQQLIFSYCNIDSLKKQRFPSLFFTLDELSTYSPISQLITSLQYHPESYNEHSTFNEKTFLINHRNSCLFHYLCSTE